MNECSVILVFLLISGSLARSPGQVLAPFPQPVSISNADSSAANRKTSFTGKLHFGPLVFEGTVTSDESEADAHADTVNNGNFGFNAPQTFGLDPHTGGAFGEFDPDKDYGPGFGAPHPIGAIPHKGGSNGRFDPNKNYGPGFGAPHPIGAIPHKGGSNGRFDPNQDYGPGFGAPH